MQIALALYPNFTMLDIIGPFQVLVDARLSCYDRRAFKPRFTSST
jgi:hypothetical protein